MENNIKINFENYLNKKNFSSSQKEIKESNFNNFIKNGFPNKRIEDWKFSDLKQIITTNFENIDFSKKEEQSNIEENFTFDLEHNKIIFINGIISKIDFSYEEEKKIISSLAPKSSIVPIEKETKFYPVRLEHQNYYKKNTYRYEYYRFMCGRDSRLEELNK